MAPSSEAVNAWTCISLASPIVGIAVNVVAQISLFRNRHGAEFFHTIFVSALMGLAACLILEAGLIIARQNQLYDALWLSSGNILAYLALSYCYYHFVQLGQTSIRIRLCVEIAASKGGLTVQEIAARYSDKMLMGMRLQRLLESGDIVQRDGRYFVRRSRFVRVAQALFTARRFLLGRASELN